jgi:anti-sigma regulatory factor (Ser/Thr protein kinase)
MTVVNSVRGPSQVAETRRAAASIARRKGLGKDIEARVALVATELATNLSKHADGGVIAVNEFADADGSGIELLALDMGPGMADVARCLIDGFSTVGSPGNGLGAVARVSDRHASYSRPGAGTAVMARFLTAIAIVPGSPEIRAIIDTYPGESVCG